MRGARERRSAFAPWLERYYAFRHSIAVAVMRSLAQDNAQQRVVDLETPLYSMNPNLRNLFMKKLTRDCVVPIISASVS